MVAVCIRDIIVDIILYLGPLNNLVNINPMLLLVIKRGAGAILVVGREVGKEPFITFE